MASAKCTATTKLQVEGSYEDWMEILKLLYDGGEDGNLGLLSSIET